MIDRSSHELVRRRSALSAPAKVSPTDFAVPSIPMSRATKPIAWKPPFPIHESLPRHLSPSVAIGQPREFRARNSTYDPHGPSRVIRCADRAGHVPRGISFCTSRAETAGRGFPVGPHGQRWCVGLLGQGTFSVAGREHTAGEAHRLVEDSKRAGQTVAIKGGS